MSLLLRGLAGVGLYVALALLPLAVASTTAVASPRPFVVEFAAALGFIAFSLTLGQFALVSRWQAASRPFGTDALVQFHQQVGVLTVILVGGHVLFFAGHGATIAALNPFAGSPVVRWGSAAVWGIGLITATSLAPRRWRLSYEAWQGLHLALAVAITGAVLSHLFAAQGYSRSWSVRGVLALYAAGVAMLAIGCRIVRPMRLRRRPWVVTANDDVGGSTRLVRLRPDGHTGLVFQPGQFAWLLTGRSPLLSQQHPLSLASSSEPTSDGHIEFAVKALGDWSSTVVPALVPGRRVWVDGPFGAFTIDRAAGQGFVLIAGGIGIAPMRSMLLTMRDRRDRREVVLIHAANSAARALFVGTCEALTRELNLTVVPVFEAAPPEWHGERGHITAELLRRHLPSQWRRFHYFVCGPVPMMNAMEGILLELGVPAAAVDTERFAMV